MTNQNKENLVQFGKVAMFGLLVFAAIIALMGIYNGCGINSFYGFVGTLNFAVEVFFFEVFFFVKLYKKLFKEEKQK